MSDLLICAECIGEHTTPVDSNLCPACEAERLEGDYESPDAEHARENRSTHEHVSRSSYTF